VDSRGSHHPWGRWGLRLIAITYLLIMLLIPLLAVVQDGLSGGLTGLWTDLTRPAARAALWLSLWTAAVMTVINAIMGTITAYVLVRYRFPGQTLVNALIDVPFAIPTLVTGVMLVILYGPQAPLGGWVKDTLGLDVIFAPPGIILALLFISLPFVVRTVQPVLMSIDLDQEQAAYTLGASSWKTFYRVLLPALTPAILTGSLLAFARALGEFGSVVVVAGNIPMRSQVAAVYVLSQIESDNQRGASAMSLVMLAVAFLVIVTVDLIQRRQPHAEGAHA
jgi:sulfate transport system permease protein